MSRGAVASPAKWALAYGLDYAIVLSKLTISCTPRFRRRGRAVLPRCGTIQCNPHPAHRRHVYGQAKGRTDVYQRLRTVGPLRIPCSCPFKRDMGLDFTKSFVFFFGKYFHRKMGLHTLSGGINAIHNTILIRRIDPRGSRSILKCSIFLVQKIVIFHP